MARGCSPYFLNKVVPEISNFLRADDALKDVVAFEEKPTRILFFMSGSLFKFGDLFVDVPFKVGVIVP